MIHAANAPTRTATEPHRRPKPKPRALPKATPAPIVRISPGTNRSVATQKMTANTTIPANGQRQSKEVRHDRYKSSSTSSARASTPGMTGLLPTYNAKCTHSDNKSIFERGTCLSRMVMMITLSTEDASRSIFFYETLLKRVIQRILQDNYKSVTKTLHRVNTTNGIYSTTSRVLLLLPSIHAQ